MKLLGLTQILKEKYDCRMIGVEKEREITHFRFLTKGMIPERENCLYIGSANDISEGGCMKPIVLLTTEEVDLELFPEGTSIIVLPPVELNNCMNEVTNLFFKEQELEEQFGELVKLPLENKPLHEIVNQVADFLGRSLVLTDLGFRVLAHSTSYPITDPIWFANIARGYCTYEFVAAMNELLPENELPDTAEAFLVNCAVSTENKLCSQIFYEQHPIGYLIMLDNNNGILPYHLDYLPRISHIMTLALQHLPNFQGMFLNAGENLFLNLLEKKNDLTERESALLNLKLPMSMRCLVFHAYHNSVHDKFYLKRYIGSLFPNDSVFLYQEDVIAVIREQHVSVLQQLDKELAKNVKEVGVSACFTNVREFPTQLEYATKACKMAKKMRGKGKIHFYEDYQFYHILESCNQEKLLREYMHPALEVLYEHDLTHDMQLLKTLRIYVENGLQGKKTAEFMYLHRNSLNYRLNKIEELTGIDFENLETVFRLNCSFRINRLLQIFNC